VAIEKGAEIMGEIDPAETRRNMEAAFKNMEVNEEHFEMGARKIAEMYYCRYKALKDAGFSEDQAFDIVKARGLE
jgi:hypothetical protein